MSNSSICPIDRTLSGATLRAREDLGTSQWRGNPHFQKVQHYWSLTIRLFNIIYWTPVVGGFYLSAEMQSVYSTDPGDWGPCSMFIFTNPSARAGYDTRSIFFKEEFNRFWIQSFPSPRLVASPRLKSLVCPNIYWRENNWIHTFPKGISAMWNAISLFQDLNSCRRVHFLRR